MKFGTLMSVAVAAALITSLAPVAVLAEAGDHAARMQEHFDEVDANGDGVVSRDEAEAMAAAHFVEADSDSSGNLSEEEAIAFHRSRRDERRDARREMREDRHEGRFAEASGEDGVIDLSEFSDHALRRFEGADLDENGTVTATEMRLAMRAHHAARRGAMHGGDDD